MSDQRKTHAELMSLLLNCPASYVQWRHKKSGVIVTVIDAALLESTLEPVVVYDHEGVNWVRSVNEFREKFECLESEEDVEE